MAADTHLSVLMSLLSCWEIAGYAGLAIVIIGVIGEGIHDFTTWFKRTWWGPHGGRFAVLVLIAGLAIEGVAQVKANSTSGQIIAVLSNQAADTRERAAIHEKEAAQLRLDLAKMRAPRNIDANVQNTLVERLKPIGTKLFNIGTPVGGLEPGSGLDEQLFTALSLSGWKMVPLVSKPSARGQPASNSGRYVIVGVVGVKVTFGSLRHDDFVIPAQILSEELNKSGISTQVIELPPEDDGDANAIHIAIGAKT
jgi:hypothetical protein